MEKDYKEKYNNLKDAPEAAYEMEDEDVVVVLTNEDGEVTYYREETIITVGDDRFAVLVGLALDPDGEETEELPEEDEAVIAKIVVEDGEDVYVDPSEEEVEAVLAVYGEREENREG